MKMPDFGKITLRLLGNVARTEHLVLQEFKVKKGSKLTKKTKLDIVKDTGVIIMAEKRSRSKRYSINMPFKAKIKSGNIIAMGTARQLDEFEKYKRR